MKRAKMAPELVDDQQALSAFGHWFDHDASLRELIRAYEHRMWRHPDWVMSKPYALGPYHLQVIRMRISRWIQELGGEYVMATPNGTAICLYRSKAGEDAFTTHLPGGVLR